MSRLIIEDNSVYEVDEECLEKYKNNAKNSYNQKNNKKPKGDNNNNTVKRNIRK